MALSYMQTREEICDIAHRLWQLGFVAANDGNISVKLEDDLYITTPTGVSKSMVTPDKLVLVDGQGQVLEASGGYRPSSEFPMHLRCYAERADVRAVVHAHPPTATGFAIAHIPLDSYTMPEAVLTIGSVPIAPYGTPSTQEIPEAIAPFLQEHDAIMLANHGAVTVGVDLMNAYFRMETLEFFAKITLTARLLGGEHEMTQEQQETLIAMRPQFGLKGRHPGIKKYR